MDFPISKPYFRVAFSKRRIIPNSSNSSGSAFVTPRINLSKESPKSLPKATEAFFYTNYKKYTDHYQQRVIGFLLERLHSYLLIKNFSQKGLNPFEMVGFTTVLSEGSFLKLSSQSA